MESKNDQTDVNDEDLDIPMKDSENKPKIKAQNDDQPIYSMDVDQSLEKSDLERSMKIADCIIINHLKSGELSENMQYVCSKTNIFQIID